MDQRSLGQYRTNPNFIVSMTWGHTRVYVTQSMPLADQSGIESSLRNVKGAPLPPWGFAGCFASGCLPSNLILCLGWDSGIDRVIQDVQGSVPFPYRSCVPFVSQILCLSFLGMSCLLFQLILQENSPHFSACHFGSSLQEPCCLPLSLPRLPVPPTCTPNNSKTAPFLGEETQRKSPLVFPQPCLTGGLGE